MENHKIVQATIGQGWATEHIDEPPVHGEHMSSRQALDIHGSGARANTANTEVVGHRLEVREGIV